MAKVVVERDVHVVPTDDGGSGTASSAIWAIAFIIIVALIAGAVYYSGILRTNPNKTNKINVEVSAPQAPAPAAPNR